MEAKFTKYDYNDGIGRIDEILDDPDASYEDHKGVPDRARLTYSNGFYVDVTVLFMDIRGSKVLSTKHKKPVLAKIYRAYISEAVALLKGNETISEIYIEGDGIWAVFNTTKKSEVDAVFVTAFQLASLIDILNIKLEKKGYSTLQVGIGLDDGESLYIKAGYKGSGLQEVVWIGKVVGGAAKLCSFGNRTIEDAEIMVSAVVYSNLSEKNKELLSWNSERDCFHGNVVSIGMDKWVQDNG